MKLKNKIKVAIIGENRGNDAESIKILLSQVAKENVDFSIYPKIFEGAQLDGAKFFRTLKAETLFFDWVILVRDLDGLISESQKLNERMVWFRKSNQILEKKGIDFLVIYELESLIISDIKNLSAYYGKKIKPFGHPMAKEKAKEYLESLTEKTQKRKYDAHDAPKIFKILDFHTIYHTHKGERSFQSFADELAEKKIIEFKKKP